MTTSPKAAKSIVLETITGKYSDPGHKAEIKPGESIRLFGTHGHRNPIPFDVTFKIGDQAEYDSYNLSYYGTITSISAKTVTITERHLNNGKKKSHRLSLDKFASRNHNFNLEETYKKNAEVMTYI